MSRGDVTESGQRFLDRLERAGNALPHPATLFAGALVLVLVLSQIAAWVGWSAERPEGAREEGTVEAVGLLGPDGLWWLFAHMVENFITFPPLGILLVAMLGIGVAERSGLLPALLSGMMQRTPRRLLTPGVVFLGIFSSVAMDAGYVVLPPLAAGLFYAAGRSPLAGLAAAFAGVSAGFSANLVLTGLDPLLAGFTQAGARIAEADATVAVTANWYFMAASAVAMTAVGWWVTARYVEPRLEGAEAYTAPEEEAQENGSGPEDVGRGLRAASVAAALVVAAFAALILIPGAPLHGPGATFARWVEAMVPLLLVGFLVPGLAYGVGAGTIRSDRDAVRLMADTIAALAPYIVLAFFAAQFVEAFNHSRLGLLLAITGGEWLARAAVPGPVLVLGFIVLVMAGNLFIGSASAKYAFFAPVFVPMLMQVGIEPELTQAAYRVGDSVTNIITPLNPYWIIILGFVQRWRPEAGVGTLLALMIPYAAAFALAWPALLLAWMAAGLPLGPG